MDWPDHLPPLIHIETYSDVTLCPVFYLKVYLYQTEPCRKKSDGSQVSSLFLGNIGHHMLVCAKTVCSWSGRFYALLKHICLQVLWQFW